MVHEWLVMEFDHLSMSILILLCFLTLSRVVGVMILLFWGELDHFMVSLLW
jgi:hypothetical protein